MGIFRILLVLFLLIPLIEIYFLIKVGTIVGAIPTVFLVVFTAVLGALLLRFQGFSTLGRVRSVLARGEIPAIEMMEGAVLLICGALLLTPGFFTDAIGFLCLVPSIRRGLIMWFLRRSNIFVDVHASSRVNPQSPGQDDAGHGPRTIEGEYSREDDHRH